MQIFIYGTDKMINGQFGCYEIYAGFTDNKEECYQLIDKVCKTLYERYLSVYFGYSLEQFKRELFQYKIWRTVETFSNKEIEMSFNAAAVNAFVSRYCFPHEGLDSPYFFKTKKYLGIIKTSLNICKNVVIEGIKSDELEKSLTPAAMTLYKENEMLQKELSLKQFSINWYYVTLPFKEELQKTSAQTLQKLIDTLDTEVIIALLCDKG